MLPSSAKAIFLVSALALGLSACSTTSTPGSDPWETATRAQWDALQDSSSLDGVTVPVLKAPALATAWGAPTIKRDGSGGYLLTYSDPKHPFTRLMIHGMSKPLPALTTPPELGGEEMVNDQLTGFHRPQAWKHLTVASQNVRWFQESTSGGADGAYYSTEGFTLTGPDGRQGHYRLNAEAGDDPEVPARWFRGVSF